MQFKNHCFSLLEESKSSTAGLKTCVTRGSQQIKWQREPGQQGNNPFFGWNVLKHPRHLPALENYVHTTAASASLGYRFGSQLSQAFLCWIFVLHLCKCGFYPHLPKVAATRDRPFSWPSHFLAMTIKASSSLKKTYYYAHPAPVWIHPLVFHYMCVWEIDPFIWLLFDNAILISWGKSVLSDVLVQRCTKKTTDDCFLRYKAKLSVRLNWLHCFLLYNCALCDKQDPLKQHFKSNASYFAADPNIFFPFLPIAFYLCVFWPSVLIGFSGWYATVFCLLWCTVWKFVRCWLKKQPLMPQNPLLNLVSKHYVTEKDDCRDPTAICCSTFPWRLNGGKWAAVECALCRSHTSFSDDQGLRLPSFLLRATTDLTQLL